MDENPYASPKSTGAPAKPPRDGIWRQKNLLVVGREANLPDICPLTNLPAEIRWPTKVRVLFPSQLALGLILCPPVGVLFYGIFAVEGTRMKIPLRRSVLAARNFHRRNTIVLLIIAALLMAAELLSIPPPPVGIIGEGLMVWGWLIILIAAVYDTFLTTLFTVQWLTADHTWIAGCNPDYLARFDEFPT